MHLNFISILTTMSFSVRALSCSALNRKNILIIIMSIELMCTVTFINAAPAGFLEPKVGLVRSTAQMIQDKVSSIKVKHQDKMVMRPIEQVLTESYIKIDELTRSLKEALNSSMNVASPHDGTLALITETGEKTTTTPLQLDQVQDIASQIISNCGGLHLCKK